MTCACIAKWIYEWQLVCLHLSFTGLAVRFAKQRTCFVLFSSCFSVCFFSLSLSCALSLFQHSIMFNEQCSYTVYCPDAEILVFVFSVCMWLFHYWSTTNVINVRDIFNCVQCCVLTLFVAVTLCDHITKYTKLPILQFRIWKRMFLRASGVDRWRITTTK